MEKTPPIRKSAVCFMNFGVGSRHELERHVSGAEAVTTVSHGRVWCIAPPTSLNPLFSPREIDWRCCSFSQQAPFFSPSLLFFRDPHWSLFLFVCLFAYTTHITLFFRHRERLGKGGVRGKGERREKKGERREGFKLRSWSL